MKRHLSLIIPAFFAFTAPLFCDLNNEITVDSNWLEDKGTGQGDSLFNVKVDFDATGKADFKHKNRGHVSFAEASAIGTATFYADPCYKEAAFAIAGYDYTRIHWNRNPYFDQSNFNTLVLGLGAVSHRLDDWLWQAQLNANFDLNHFKFNDNITWDMLAWGMYDYCSGIHLHFGFLAYTGMKYDRVYPIVGIDWRVNQYWKINAIFPVKMSLQYLYNDQWSASLAAKLIQSRHRAGPHERVSRAIIVYTAGGIELGVDYTSLDERFTVNAHIGEILGGRVKVANMHYHHKRRFRFCTAPYVGGEIAYRF